MGGTFYRKMAQVKSSQVNSSQVDPKLRVSRQVKYPADPPPAFRRGVQSNQTSTSAPTFAVVGLHTLRARRIRSAGRILRFFVLMMMSHTELTSH